MRIRKLWIHIAIITLFLSTFCVNRLFSWQTEITHDCDVVQGFNFNSSGQETFGFLNDLQIGTTELHNDLSLVGPDLQAMSATGVLANIYWGGGYADPIQISAQISVANKNLVTIFLLSTPADISVKFSFVVYKYDPVSLQYFKCFYHSASLLEGNIQISGSDMELHMSAEASYEVQNPLNYNMLISITPGSLSQSLDVAVSPDAKLVRPWGIGTSVLDPSPEIVLPKEIELEPVYPNPFNPQTTIAYKISKDTNVRLTVYNIMGRVIQILVDTPQAAGSYQVYWNGEDQMRRPAASGAYLIVLKAGTTKKIQKVLLMR